NGTFIYKPEADFNGSDSFAYDICSQGNDDTSLCDNGTVDITVTPVNDSPVSSTDGPYAVTEDVALHVPAPGVLGNDSDIDGDSLTAYLVTAPTNGLLELGSSGAFTYTADLDYNGPDGFAYEACDGTVCVEANVTLQVTAVNDPPVGTDDQFGGDEDNDITGNVLTNDIDVDSPNLLVQELSSPAHGALSLDVDGDFTYSPALDYSGMDTFTYEVCDSGGLCDSATVNLAISAVVDTPSLTVAPASGQEGTPITLSITAAPGDTDGSESLEIKVSGLPAGAYLSAGTVNGGVWTLNPEELAGLSLTIPDDGTYTLTVEATATEQGTNLTNTVSTALPVTVTNVAPTVDSIDLSSTSVRVGEDLTATVSISDPGGGETLTVTFDWGDGTTETFTTSDGTVTIDGVHQYQVEGFFIIVLTIDDGDSSTEATSETLIVYNPGDAFLTGGGSINVYKGMCSYSNRCANKGGTANS
ncbi:MAG: tandem-95 repeat protein, partial [Saprospiraceae bacterium]|nr:tandem-95 repeat protein [Saprospiraceae bacterium]